MDKKTWIVIAISCGIVALAVAAVLVCLLFILPSYQETDAQKEAYQTIDQSKYTFSDKDKKIDKDPDPIVYKVTNDDLVDGVKTDKFDEGNINPFTPKKDVNIYNEPTLNIDENKSEAELTPSDK